MSIQFKIQTAKDIIFESKNCGVDNDISEVGNKCAIAVASKQLFPQVYITNFHIFPFGIQGDDV